MRNYEMTTLDQAYNTLCKADESLELLKASQSDFKTHWIAELNWVSKRLNAGIQAKISDINLLTRVSKLQDVIDHIEILSCYEVI